MSLGVFFSESMLDNVTSTVFHGIGGTRGPGGSDIIGGAGGPIGSTKKCVDLNGRFIPSGVHYVPGPDECTLCVCEDGGPKWCKAVLCSPPQDCKSFRVGNSCCDFICLDDSLKNGKGGTTGGPFGPVDITEVVPKIVIAAVTAMLSLSLLLFLIHRLRQRQIQGRINSAEARRSAQMCDECDDTRSLDYSMDYFERGTSQSIYPPSYLAWWKPPSSYFPPRGEAPPPYEEAIASTSNCLPMTMPYININGRQTAAAATTATTSLTNTTILTNENINPNPSCVGGKNNNAGQKCPKTTSKAKLKGQSKSIGDSNLNPSDAEVTNRDSATENSFEISTEEPQPGPSTRLSETEAGNNDTMVALATDANLNINGRHSVGFINTAMLPAYDDGLALHLHPGRDYFRHSLTLPRRHDLLFEGDSNNYYAGGGSRRNQRYSLQFNVVDWSSSSSTLSLSTPTSPNDLGLGRGPSLSSSSSSTTSNNTHN